MMEPIGPYEATRELGRGGVGVVYLDTDTRLNRQVAIKALPAELASDPARLERFEREARTLAGLSHPNIASICGVEEQDDAKCLVLEFVEGETLADVLDRGPVGGGRSRRTHHPDRNGRGGRPTTRVLSTEISSRQICRSAMLSPFVSSYSFPSRRSTSMMTSATPAVSEGVSRR